MSISLTEFMELLFFFHCWHLTIFQRCLMQSSSQSYKRCLQWRSEMYQLAPVWCRLSFVSVCRRLFPFLSKDVKTKQFCATVVCLIAFLVDKISGEILADFPEVHWTLGEIGNCIFKNRWRMVYWCLSASGFFMVLFLSNHVADCLAVRERC